MIPFTADKFLAGLASGELQRFGGIIKDAATGKIVGHLQETGIAQQMLNCVVRSPLDFANPLTMTSSIASNIQLAQVTSMMEGLRILGFANTAATIAGIGVSVAGFALMNKRFNQMEQIIVRLEKQIEKGFRNLQWQSYRSHFFNLQGFMDHADQLHYTNATKSDWLQIAGELARESSFFRGELQYLLDSEGFDKELFLALSPAYSAANTIRLQMIVNSGDLQAARQIAEDMVLASQQIFDDVTPTDLVRKVMVTHRDDSDEYTHDQTVTLKTEINQLVQGVREAQDVTATRPLLIDALLDENIDGREFMNTMRAEDETPFLVLPAH